MRKIPLILTVFFLCIFLSTFIMGNIMHIIPIGIKGKAAVGEPYYFVDESVRWGEITDFAVCGEKLYILFSGKELLDCYDLDGTYLHSYSFKLGDKGKAALFVNNGVLYLKSKEFTFYMFCDGYFVESYDVPVTGLYSEINKLSSSKVESGRYIYKLCGSSIWRESNGLIEEVVHRPTWMAVFQGNSILLISSVSFIFLCLILFHYKKIV